MTYLLKRARSGWVVALVVVLAFGSGCSVASPKPSPAASRAAAGRAIRGSVVATVRLPDYGNDVAIGADGRAYVTVASNKVVIVDTAAAKIAATVDVDGEPYALAVTPDGRRAYAVDLRGAEVAVVDTAHAKQKSRIPLGTMRPPSQRPSAVISADGQRVFVGQSGRDHLVVIRTDADQIEKDLFLDFHPVDVAVSSDGRFVFVVGCRLACVDGTLLIVETQGFSTVRRIELPSVPTGMVVTPNGRRAYVANGRDGTVSSIDLVTQQPLATIQVGPEPGGIAIDAAGTAVYVTSFTTGRLSAIATATNSVVATTKVGAKPRAVVVSRDDRRAFVTHATNTLSIVDLSGFGR
ncbi:MAG: YncE family protein [Candidatus Binatia bacterium]